MDRLQHLMNEFDHFFSAWINPEVFPRCFSAFQLVADSASLIVYGIPLFMIAWNAARRRPQALYRSVALLLIVAVTAYAALVLHVCMGGYEPITRHAGSGQPRTFPSESTVAAVSLAVSATLLFPRSIVGFFLFLFAVMVAVSRIYLGVYHPTEIVGTVVLGFAMALFIIYTWRKLQMS